MPYPYAIRICYSCTGVEHIDPVGVEGGIGADQPHPFLLGLADEVWLTHVGQLGWVAVFRNNRIRYRPAERDALTRYAVRAVSITTNRNLKIAEQASLIGEHMPRIELLVAEPPAYYTLNAAGLRRKFVY